MGHLYSDEIEYSVPLLGTPAEEGGGRKPLLINAGAYKDVDACFMIHLFPVLSGAPGYLANDNVEVTFTEKPAHASGTPWEGINALDAMVSCLCKDFNVATADPAYAKESMGPNVIPASTTVKYYIRWETVKTLKPFTEKVLKRFEAAGTATGYIVEYKWDAVYKDMKTNKPICDSYVSAMNAMGHSTIFDGRR
ncbi:Peptidase M20D amidohydrolase predicted [Penicillium robsamsonii]|uniref:Peptidase M20D amidohydrolase predicted n=1 Tax=Penicillium robsamsonii TaxID=1792511 RepID=UPI0025484887|nr:Peptidase M20D amidohydrolase predicted [Penicillium robsamsonii]KAJ5835329.1 Peptidase M20D amidohydrolase predicted [Penicillium robsamsonii]